MRRIISYAITTAMIANPTFLLAGNQFVIVDAVRSLDGGQVVTSLIAGNTLEQDADGALTPDNSSI